MCVLVCVNQVGFGSMVPSLPLYASSFGVSASAVGLAVAIYGVARLLWGMNAAAMSAYRMTADAGYIVGPLGLSLVADVTGPAAAILAASAVLILIGLLFAIAAPGSQRF